MFLGISCLYLFVFVYAFIVGEERREREKEKERERGGGGGPGGNAREGENNGVERGQTSKRVEVARKKKNNEMLSSEMSPTTMDSGVHDGVLFEVDGGVS